MQPLTHSEVRALIDQAGVDQETRDFWIRYTNNVFNATWMTEEERQRKIDILLDAIDAKQEATYYNRFDVILRDTAKETFEDLKGVGEDVVGLVKHPATYILIACCLGMFILLRR